MSAGETPYHHGDLRQTLLIAAAEEIRAVGVGRVSLRELARRAGVSHAAPAHHFGDKTGLFTALAADGFRLLHESTSQTLGRPDALVRAGERYVQFALGHPSHFSVMFDPSLLDGGDQALTKERDVAFDVFHRAVAATTGADDEAALASQTLAAWSVVHGLATLWLTGNLPYPPDAEQVPSVFIELSGALRVVATASLAHLE